MYKFAYYNYSYATYYIDEPSSDENVNREGLSETDEEYLPSYIRGMLGVYRVKRQAVETSK